MAREVAVRSTSAGPADSTGDGGQAGNGRAARPQLLRALNEQLLLSHIRQLGS